MSGDPNGLTISLSSFWQPANISSQGRDVDQGSKAAGENAWEEFVVWFEQHHEWMSLVSSFEDLLD